MADGLGPAGHRISHAVAQTSLYSAPLGGLPAMQAALDRTLSLASQLPQVPIPSMPWRNDRHPVGAGLPAMQAALDRALSLASQLPQLLIPRMHWRNDRHPVGAVLPAMQAALERALSLASQLPQALIPCMHWRTDRHPVGAGLPAMAAVASPRLQDTSTSLNATVYAPRHTAPLPASAGPSVRHAGAPPRSSPLRHSD